MIVAEPGTGGLQGAFRALGDPTRRGILLLLRDRDMTIQEVSDRFPITRAAIKKHLDILETGKLISVHPSGRERVNRLEPAALAKANDWFDHFSRFWDGRLQALKTRVEQDETEDDTSAEPAKPEGNTSND
ncbi:metalloregulator ArsR/SmtB family transcription factor [Roseibium sp. AS2]|uniref:ArsR/SmtB family transcription factor n=1 Tax=Roseibium sp. AS2 TaxID=3135781 RepID=UPI00316FFB88